MPITISEKIQKIRKERKLTQEQLGDMLGISGQAVSKWESGASMPDIMLLPELCEILGISVEALLEMPATTKLKDILGDFCKYANEVGKSKAIIEVISKMFGCENSDNSNAVLSSDGIRVSDKRGLGFVLEGQEYTRVCLEMKNEEIAFFLRIFTDEVCLSVLKLISIDNAITKYEIAEKLSLDEATTDRILLGLMKRNLICFGIDEHGKHGYIHSANMIGGWMILCGCYAAGYGGEQIGSLLISRK